MCGVIGAIRIKANGTINPTAIRVMLNMTQARGHHATGLAFRYNDGTIQYRKEAGEALRVSDEFVNTLLKNGSPSAVIGHCRHWTSGDPKNNENNHPHHCSTHRYGPGLMVHNGVVAGHKALAERQGVEMKTECDSEVLALMFAKFADDDEKLSDTGVLKKLAEESNSSSDTCLYLTQKAFGYHKSGMLWVGVRGGVLYYCSTEDPIKWIGCKERMSVPHSECRMFFFDKDGVGHTNDNLVAQMKFSYQNYITPAYKRWESVNTGSNSEDPRHGMHRIVRHPAHVIDTANPKRGGSRKWDPSVGEFVADDTPLAGVVPIVHPVHGYTVNRHSGD